MIRDQEWSFRDEIFAAAHRWYVIVLCCLIGSLVGWLLSYVWPSPSQASKELFVGLNVSPSTSERSTGRGIGLPVVNANDYKNWQMASLNTVIFTDAVIKETLNRLRALNPYWNSVSPEQLAGMLRVYWRNAGKWRLVAEHQNPLYASDAVMTWEDVVVDHVHQAVTQSQAALQIDLELQAASAALAQTDAQLAALKQHRQLAQASKDKLASLPAADTIGETERTEMQTLLVSIDPAELRGALETSFPAADRPAVEYITWLDRSDGLMENEIQNLTALRLAQEEASRQLSTKYSRAVSASSGLAPELIVQKLSDRKLRQNSVRPTGQAMLIGAALGWIAWALVWLGRPALRAGV